MRKSRVLAILTLLQVLEKLSSTTTIPVPVYCNNQDAVLFKKKPDRRRSYIQFMEANADLDAEIRLKLRSLVAPVHLIHLKGYQDDQKGFQYESASLLVRLKIDMDEEAEAFVHQSQGRYNPKRMAPFYPASCVALKIHDSIIINNIKDHIKLHKNGPPMESRLIRKNILQAQHLPWIQWRGFERAMKRLKTIYKITATKIIYHK